MDRVQQLREELKRGSPEVRRRAARVLGKNSDSTAIESLIEAFKDEDVLVRVEAQDSLVKIGKSATRALIEALKDQSVQFYVHGALLRIGRPAIQLLIDALRDANSKGMAKFTLSQLGQQAIKPLVKSLARPEICEEVAFILSLKARLQAEPVEEPLLKALMIPAYRKGALRALRHIIILDLQGRLPLLLRVLAVLKEQRVIDDVEKQTSEFIPLLVNLLNGTSRHEAATALCMIGSSASPYLVNLISDNTKGQNARWCAAYVLGETKDTAGVEVLVKALEDESSSVSLQAAQALGQIGDTRALKPLLSALKSNHIRSEAVEALVNSPSLSQALAAFNQKAAAFFCVWCLSRFESQKVESHSRHSLVFFSCRKCGGISHIVEDIERAIVVLDSRLRDRLNQRNVPESKGFRIRQGEVIHNLAELSTALRNMDDSSYRDHVTKSKNDFAKWVREVFGYSELAENLEKSADRIWATSEVEKYLKIVRHITDSRTLLINWFWYREPFDFDEVRIIDADDFEVEEFVMKIRNDADQWRQSRYHAIPVYIFPSAGLSQAKVNLLRGTFAKVESKAAEE